MQNLKLVSKGGLIGNLPEASKVRSGAKDEVAELAKLQANELLHFLRRRAAGHAGRVLHVKEWLGDVVLPGCHGMKWNDVKVVIRKALEHLLQNRAITAHKPPGHRYQIEEWSLQIL